MSLRPIAEMREVIFGSLTRQQTEAVPFREASGRILAEDVIAPHDVPHFANSSMDGFAVRSADVRSPGAVLEILADVPAGQVAEVSVGEGEAIRIMTGAPMPDGADAVVRVEDTSVEDNKVHIGVSVESANYVRSAGGDVKAGAVVFRAGTRLGAMHLGVLATIGVTEPVVYRRPVVAVMSTGDELLPPETEELGPGMIRDSNRPMLVTMIQDVGAEVLDMGRIPDDPDTLRAAIGRAAAESDAIVTSGGVSMGDYDVTKLVLRDEVGIDFVQVAMQPGKPLAFGKIGAVPFFGLPGNPVSSMISFETFVRPALLEMLGASAVFRPRVNGVAGEEFRSDPAKETFLRVKVSSDGGTWIATQTGGQDSNVLSGAADAQALAVIPVGVGTVAAGDAVTLELLRHSEMKGREHA